MTLKQFDTLYLAVQALAEQNKKLTQEVGGLKEEVKELKGKTLVVTTLDQKLYKLETDVAALIDERRA